MFRHVVTVDISLIRRIEMNYRKEGKEKEKEEQRRKRCKWGKECFGNVEDENIRRRI